MIDVEDITTTIFYYNKKYEKKYITDFEFLNTFRYKGYDFYLLKVKNLYKICMPYSETDLISVWDCKTDINEYEAKNIFKKNIDKYELTKKDYETFMFEPKKYKKKKSGRK
jgi:hypothetical protein